MNWINSYIAKKKATELERFKEALIRNTIDKITSSFEPIEQAEIVNQIVLRLFDKTKEGRASHLKLAREYQEAIKEINLKTE